MPLLIGSLPLTAVKKAVEAVFFTCPKSPSWPQLPKVSIYEGMNLQYLEGIPGWHLVDGKIGFKHSSDVIDEISIALDKLSEMDLNYFAMTEKHSLCFNPFLEELSNRDNVEIIKGQVIGPVTFLTSHKILDFGMLIKDDIYRELIPKILALKARYQIDRFRQIVPDKDYIIFFDEPILSQIGSAVTSINKEDAFEILSEAMSSLDCYKGIHICGNSDWDFILKLPIHIVNFDAFNYVENFILYEKSIIDFVDNGGYIALGVVPTDSDELKKIDKFDILKHTKGALLKLKDVIGEELIKTRIFITPSCGMGALTEEEANKVLLILKFITTELQTKGYN